MGRIVAITNPDSIRTGIHQIYAQLKRNKVIVASWQGSLCHNEHTNIFYQKDGP
jgi:hypothetical protein